MAGPADAEMQTNSIGRLACTSGPSPPPLYFLWSWMSKYCILEGVFTDARAGQSDP